MCEFLALVFQCCLPGADIKVSIRRLICTFDSPPKGLSGFETTASPWYLHSPLLKKMENIIAGHIRRIWQFTLIFLLWGPPGQEVNSFRCGKLAVAGDGGTEPDRSASFPCTANPVAPSECSQCGSGTSIYTNLYPFQRNRLVLLLRVIYRCFFCVVGAVFVPVGQGEGERRWPVKAGSFIPVAFMLWVMQQYWDQTELGFMLPLCLLQSLSGCHLTEGKVLQTAFRCVSQSSEVMV